MKNQTDTLHIVPKSCLYDSETCKQMYRHSSIYSVES